MEGKKRAPPPRVCKAYSLEIVVCPKHRALPYASMCEGFALESMREGFALERGGQGSKPPPLMDKPPPPNTEAPPFKRGLP